jgi:HD-like signal output (HDOD) protein
VSGRYSEELLELPAQAAAALGILHGVDEPYSDARHLAALIETDLALSARVLRLANSVQYGAPRRVTNVGHAVGLLGVDTVRAMAISASCALLDEAPDAAAQMFWRHAIVTASASAAVAAELGTSTSDAFSAGLLHDLGSWLLHRRDPVQFSAAQSAGSVISEVLAAEIELFGASHPMVGAEALDAWCFPAPFVEATACHHGIDEPQHMLGRIVRAGEAIALHLQPEIGHPSEIGVDRLLDQVRLPASRLSVLCRRTEQRLAETATVLTS